MTGIYKHYKGGIYAVLGICSDSTNGRDDAKMVLYYSLEKHQIHVREIAEFHEIVKWPDGKLRARFLSFDPKPPE